jgi:hypothetical protein
MSQRGRDTHTLDAERAAMTYLQATEIAKRL